MLAPQLRGIAKCDREKRKTEIWMPKEFCGEPMFAVRKNASPEEDDAYILSVLLNGKVVKESEVVIFRANAIACHCGRPDCTGSLGYARYRMDSMVVSRMPRRPSGLPKKLSDDPNLPTKWKVDGTCGMK